MIAEKCGHGILFSLCIDCLNKLVHAQKEAIILVENQLAKAEKALQALMCIPSVVYILGENHTIDCQCALCNARKYFAQKEEQK